MTIDELIELLEYLKESGCSGREVLKIAYQPRYPLESGLNHLYKTEDGVYLCMTPYGGNSYAPSCVFEDEENFLK